MSTQKIPMEQPRSLQESILVVKRANLFEKHPAWHGIKKVDINYFLNLIQQKKEFLPRATMEQDENYKQIIPYLVFTYQNKYFLMQRDGKASEQRLKSKFSLGIGGHVRQEDVTGNDIFQWAKREFNEEVEYHGDFEIKPIGLLNDDSNAVGRVHLGLVLLINGTSEQIKIKSELQSGQLIPYDECKNYYQQMETWSQLVFSFL